MANTQVGTAYVKIMPSAKGFSNAVKGEMSAGGGAPAIGKSFGSKLGIAMLGGYAALKVGQAIKKSISLGAELQQNLGGTQAVFGKFAKEIQGNAQSAYLKMGLSASDYMATANKMGSLFQGSGIKQQASLDLTSKAMQRAADVASVMGLDTKLAMESIAGAAKGNFTMMDNLGVAMNATTLQAYALEKGLNFKWNTATNAQKSQLAMEMFFEKTKQYAGNFKRESTETISGSVGAWKAALADLGGKMALGKDITPQLKALGRTTLVMAKNIGVAVWQVVSALPKALRKNGASFFKEGGNFLKNLADGFLKSLPKWINTAKKLIPRFVKSLADGHGKFLQSGVRVLLSVAQGIIKALPKIIVAVGELVVVVISSLIKNLPKFIANGIKFVWALGVGFVKALPALGKVAWSIVKTILKILLKLPGMLLKLGIAIIKGLVRGLLQAVGGVIKVFVGIVRRIKSTISRFSLFKVGRAIMTSLWRGLKSIFKSIADWVKSKVDWLKNKLNPFGGLTDKLDKVSRRAPARVNYSSPTASASYAALNRVARVNRTTAAYSHNATKVSEAGYIVDEVTKNLQRMTIAVDGREIGRVVKKQREF